MASGAAPCSEQRAEAEREKGSGAGRGRRLEQAGQNGHGGRGQGGGRMGAHCDLCVVCGDRACNHHYYGVAACHGCKCFFWRSIKNKMKYICRGDGQCEINPNHRNVCRFCRLQRCLKAGMQPEAVRMPKAAEGELELAKLENSIVGSPAKRAAGKQGGGGGGVGAHGKGAAGGECPLCHQQKPKGGEAEGADRDRAAAARQQKQSQGGGGGGGGRTEAPIPLFLAGQVDRAQEEGRSQLLVRRLVEIETSINEVADFSENEAPKRQIQLDSLFDCPELLDRFRTQVNYCVRLRRVTEEEMEFCKYRTLTKVVDYIRALGALDPSGLGGRGQRQRLSLEDRVLLLRHGFAPLALFDMAAGTSFTTKDTQNLLCLPTGLTVCASEQIVPNSFLSQGIVGRCIASLVRLLTELALDQEEFVLLKLVVTLALDDSAGEEGATGAEGTGRTAEEEEGTRTGIGARGSTSGRQTLSPEGQLFVEQLRDMAHGALYRHSPKRAAGNGALSSGNPSEQAIRFAKLLHVLPKLTLLSRDLVEHMRMLHTFPSSRARPRDPLFFQLFGDIFLQCSPASGNSSSSCSSLSLFSAGQNPGSSAGGHPHPPPAYSAPFPPFVSIHGWSTEEQGEEQRQQHQSHYDGSIAHDRLANPKMISPPYKLEYNSPRPKVAGSNQCQQQPPTATGGKEEWPPRSLLLMTYSVQEQQSSHAQQREGNASNNEEDGVGLGVII